MKLDITEINHNYITRVIIFSLFAHKNFYRQPNVYTKLVTDFCKKRIPNVDILLDLGPSDPQETRDCILESILYDSDLTINIVTVYYETGYKKVSLNVNLEEEEKYELFLHG